MAQFNSIRLLKLRQKIFFSSLFCAALFGLLIRTKAEYFPTLFATYAPDVLWAFLVFALVVIFASRLTATKATIIALAIAYFMECSQLYQAPFINSIRDTRVGGLLLGHGFLWSDLLCYTVGIALGAICDFIIRKKTARRL